MNKTTKKKSQPGSQAPDKLKRKEYEAELAQLHVELVKLQEWVKSKGAKICVLFEGRDGAGKGGTIKAITERVSPRKFRVHALPSPSEREKSQMYIQRYLPHLPAAGEIVIFDRSWYNRAGVERVMGFCTDEQARRSSRPTLSGQSQIRRNADQVLVGGKAGGADATDQERITDGKSWKLSPMDLNHTAIGMIIREHAMNVQSTDTAWAPWFVAHSDDKRKHG